MKKSLKQMILDGDYKVIYVVRRSKVKRIFDLTEYSMNKNYSNVKIRYFNNFTLGDVEDLKEGLKGNPYVLIIDR